MFSKQFAQKFGVAKENGPSKIEKLPYLIHVVHSAWQQPGQYSLREFIENASSVLTKCHT
jgi:hypothetical protein